MIASIWFLFILVINVIRDQHYYLSHRAVNHNNRFWVRFFCLIPTIAILTLHLTGPVAIDKVMVLTYLALSLSLTGFVWAVLFDMALNVLRREPLLYAGSPGPEDGVIEKLLYKYPWLQWGKVVGSGILLFIYIYLS